MARHFSEFDEYDVQSEYRPIGPWGYFGYTVLFNLPVIGLICLIVFSFSQSNINRRNYARSYFIGLFVMLILFVLLIVSGVWGQAITSIQSGQYPSWLAWLFQA